MDTIYRIEYISTFHTDISNLISDLEKYPQKAKRIFETLDRKLSRLAQAPEMYQIYEDFPEFRRITVEDYLVFYTINKHDRIIEIHRLIYGRKDIIRQLE